MAAQPGVTETVDTLVCDGKTLRGLIDENASGAARFIAQVSLYSNSLGVANCFAEAQGLRDRCAEPGCGAHSMERRQ